MNVRISKDALRFRINNNELAELLAGDILHLSHITKNYYVKTGEINAPLALDLDINQAVLIVNKNTLEEFAKHLPSRDGIEYNNKDLLLALEVDVRKSRK
ncbi:MAG: hypothetical protein ABL857_01175 [Rickettsiales bacterium]|jgi:hypothetical protein